MHGLAPGRTKHVQLQGEDLIFRGDAGIADFYARTYARTLSLGPALVFSMTSGFRSRIRPRKKVLSSRYSASSSEWAPTPSPARRAAYQTKVSAGGKVFPFANCQSAIAPSPAAIASFGSTGSFGNS
jgi:hypothetical protein